MVETIEPSDSKRESILRWLHITDLHVGHTNESQRTALRSLIGAIEQFSNGKPFGLVIMTGDLAFSGQKEQYDALKSQVIDPLKTNPLCSRARFFAVPGNHDLDCDTGYPPVWKELGHKRQEAFFHLDDSGRQIRSARAPAFKGYQDFIARAGIESVDPTTAPALLIRIPRNPRPLAIISAVTAFFSDKEVSDRQRTPAPVHPLRTFLQDLTEDTQAIILGHHPLEWFTPDSETPFHSLLVERNALYLHGHEHKIRSRFGVRGLISLGFGAAYQAAGDGPQNPPYRNSFAICELEDSLHVCIASWDAENGQWRPDHDLPGDFQERSTRLKDGYCLPLPTTRLAERAGRPYASIALAIRNELVFDRCIWLANNDSKRWSELLSTIGVFRKVIETYALPTQTVPAGHNQFRIKDETGHYLVHAVSGHGDILAYETLQEINTELDRQDYDACIVVTLGELSTEAETLATQLASRKRITVLERSEIIRKSIRNFPPGLEKALRNADPNVTTGCLVFTQEGLALLLQDKTMNGWFQVVGEDGAVVAESSSLVLSIRQELPALRSMRYEPSSPNNILAAGSKRIAFYRQQYLQKTYDYFDDIKYAPLAALGFRFRKASLSEIYVDASADVGGSSKATHDLTRAVSEFVESLNLPQPQRDQLESQLRSRYGLNRSVEVGAARKLYQRYNNILVLGDPGSGKTCFVQHEILAYCQPPTEQSSWYARHLPIYVSLAEAARLLDENTKLLDVCQIVSSRRGIELPREAIETALSDGRAAFFFDGLDEVGYIDRRIALLSEIDNLVKMFAPRGNRFVLASRPAAVQPVDIPEALTYLRLKGLTEEEIRVLAGRVLTARLGEQEQGVLTYDEVELINRLLEDTRNSPGIQRIARNPLLLTLLVLIYANTGALSARRHVIYTQAVKTLVSVRGRQTREQQISEADLRTRLGALALAIFQRDIAEIPKRSEVLAILAPLVPRAAGPGSSRTAPQVADAFIQEVAEATGLLTIHTREDEKSEDLITFMHFSFLEYYAAAGLLALDYRSLVPPVSGNPRWRDVTTLLFGILSEQTDVTPLLDRILAEDIPSEAISKYRTVLALDCANECDVPPELSQDLLAKAVYDTVRNGAGRYSTELRNEIARRLEYFMQGARPRIEDALARGLVDNDPVASAAFADLIARLGDNVSLSDDIVEAFSQCLKKTHAVTRAAAMYAVERRPELRNEETKMVVRASLKGSIIEKHAALKLIASVPVYQDFAADEIRALLDDPNPIISGAAAQCALVHTLRGKRWLESPALLEKVLSKLYHGEQETGCPLEGSLWIQRQFDPLFFLAMQTRANSQYVTFR